MPLLATERVAAQLTQLSKRGAEALVSHEVAGKRALSGRWRLRQAIGGAIVGALRRLGGPCRGSSTWEATSAG